MKTAKWIVVANMTTKTPHKWQKEIIAWANGYTIQCRVHCLMSEEFEDWHDDPFPEFRGTYRQYRIKPEPQVFNVYQWRNNKDRYAFEVGSEADQKAKVEASVYTFVGTFTEEPK